MPVCHIIAPKLAQTASACCSQCIVHQKQAARNPDHVMSVSQSARVVQHRNRSSSRLAMSRPCSQLVSDGNRSNLITLLLQAINSVLHWCMNSDARLQALDVHLQ